MIRLGIVDFDSSHAVEFTKRLNHRGISEDQWVEGATVIMGCSLPSAITDAATVEKYEKAFRDELGLPLVKRPEDMLGNIDAVLIESVDGSVHLERARPFLEKGLPVFVDKPFACSTEEARQLVVLAERKKLPFFSASSLRYAPEVVQFPAQQEKAGRLVGVDASCPAHLHPRNPGLFHYGIHGVEMLYALLGPGCKQVSVTSTDGADLVVGEWGGGRIGTLRGIRTGAAVYGFTAYCEKQAVHVPVGTQFIYRDLLKQIVGMFQSGKAPVPIAEQLEIVAFIAAALEADKTGKAAHVQA